MFRVFLVKNLKTWCSNVTSSKVDPVLNSTSETMLLFYFGGLYF